MPVCLRWLLNESLPKQDNMFTEFTKVKSRTEQYHDGKLLPRELNRPRFRSSVMSSVILDKNQSRGNLYKVKS